MSTEMDLSSNHPPATRKTQWPQTQWPKIVIMILIIGAVITPVWLPLEIAKWYVAAADNALRVQNLELSQDRLARASHHAPTIVDTSDYRIIQAKIFALAGDADSAIQVLSRMVQDRNADAVRVGLQLSDFFQATGDFGRALTTFQSAMKLVDDPNAIQLNAHAYLRALAVQELDQALKDIDRALRDYPDEASFLDTKAWVLYRLKRYEEAKPLMEQALAKQIDSLRNAGSFVGLDPLDLVAKEDPSQPQAEIDLSAELTEERQKEAAATRKEMEKLIQKAPGNDRRAVLVRKVFGLFQVAVLRYHMSEIYQALGNEKEAQLQWNWLFYYGLDDAEILH